MKRFLPALMLLLALRPAPAAANELVADLSDHLVEITMGFEGAELLLFGAVEGEGDVVVLVHGPPENLTVRRKGKVGPIWMNLGEMSFVGAPAFYRIMSTQLPSGWLPDAVREPATVSGPGDHRPPRGVGVATASARPQVLEDRLLGVQNDVDQAP